jgi:hypothetical protein
MDECPYVLIHMDLFGTIKKKRVKLNFTRVIQCFL